MTKRRSNRTLVWLTLFRLTLIVALNNELNDFSSSNVSIDVLSEEAEPKNTKHDMKTFQVDAGEVVVLSTEHNDEIVMMDSHWWWPWGGGGGKNSSSSGGGGEDGKSSQSCSSHRNCSECTLASSMCHWCESTNSCHTRGSIYGCIYGVNCFSEGRCRRDAPERIYGLVISQMATLPLLIVFGVAFVVFCCATMCCTTIGTVKTAYDDIMEAANSSNDRHEATIETASVSSDDEQCESDPQSQQLSDDDSKTQTTQQEEDSDESHNTEDASNAEDNAAQDPAIAPSPKDEEEQNNNLARDRHRRQRRSTSWSLFLLYNLCKFFYVITLLVMIVLITIVLMFYPKLPQFNVCSDELAWQSIIEGIAKIQVKASFQILVSIQNPNRFDINIESGSGTFTHDGAYVGRLKFPATSLHAMSITDFLFEVEFSPNKWEILSLTEDYYSNKLVFDINGNWKVHIPALMDHRFEGPFGQYSLIHVNKPSKQGRHLCACPTWAEVKNKTHVSVNNKTSLLRHSDDVLVLSQ